MRNLEQIIGCPNCQASGWRDDEECCVCDGRGLLVIDSAKTIAQPMKEKRTTTFDGDRNPRWIADVVLLELSERQNDGSYKPCYKMTPLR